MCLAALAGRADVVRLLIECDASLVTSTYTLQVTAGSAEGMSVWWATPIFAAVSYGDLGLVQELTRLGADVHSKIVSGANLLWHASYFGHDEVVVWLLSQGVDANAFSWFPEEDRLQHAETTLHVAARRGGASMVRALVAARADMCGCNGFGLTPLDVAVVDSRPEAVGALLESGAQLFFAEDVRVKTVGKKSHNSSIDLLFRHGDAGTIAAAAEGLQHVPEQAKLLSGDGVGYFTQFLRTPGDAPRKTFRSLFQPTKLRYFNGEDVTEIRSAYLSSGFSALVGPSERRLQSKVAGQDDLTVQEAVHFAEGLAPQSHGSNIHVPLEIFRCVVPALSVQHEVLEALVYQSSRTVFDEPGCRALVEVLHQDFKRLQAPDIVMTALSIFILLIVNLSMNAGVEIPLMLCIAVLLILWVVNWADVLAQVLGLLDCGLAARYWRNPCSLAEIFGLLLQGAAIVGLMLFQDQAESRGLNALLAAAVFGRWLRLLHVARVQWNFGEDLLPIFTALRSILPISGLIIFGAFGIGHSYFALGMQDGKPIDVLFALQASYRLSVLGHADLDELEFVDSDSPSSSWYGRNNFRYICMAGFALVTFATTVCLMNTFIAILCLSYAQAKQHSKREFLHQRAQVVLNRMAFLRGWQALCCNCSLCGRRSVTHATHKYIWYACSTLRGIESPRSGHSFHNQSCEIAELRETVAKQSNQLGQVSLQLLDVQSALNKLTAGSCSIPSSKQSRRRRRDWADGIPTKTVPPHPRCRELSPRGVMCNDDTPHRSFKEHLSSQVVSDSEAFFQAKGKQYSSHFVPVAVSAEPLLNPSLRPTESVQSPVSDWQPEPSPLSSRFDPRAMATPPAEAPRDGGRSQSINLNRAQYPNSGNTVSKGASPLTTAHLASPMVSPTSQQGYDSAEGSVLGSARSAAAASDAAAWQACSRDIAAIRQRSQDVRAKPRETTQKGGAWPQGDAQEVRVRALSQGRTLPSSPPAHMLPQLMTAVRTDAVVSAHQSLAGS